MTALITDRNTPEIIGDMRLGKAGASQHIFAGSILMRNAAGFILKGAVALNCRGIGRAEERVNNDGADGAKSVNYRGGYHLFATTGTAFTEADIGKVCFIVDDQTVAKDDAVGTRSPAGFVHSIQGDDIFVEFDESKLLIWIDSQ